MNLEVGIMDQGWKKISTKKVFETKWFYIDEDQLVTPSGKNVTYYIMRKSTGAVIIPFDGAKYYLVKVFRPSIFKYSWEFPMGTAESNSDQENAKTELKGETGFVAERWTCLGGYAGAPGSMDQLGKVFLAEGLKAGEPEREDAEADMEMGSFTLDELDNMVARGEIFDGWTISALYLHKLYLSKNL